MSSHFILFSSSPSRTTDNTGPGGEGVENSQRDRRRSRTHRMLVKYYRYGSYFGIRYGTYMPLRRSRDQSNPLPVCDLHFYKRLASPCITSRNELSRSSPPPSDSWTRVTANGSIRYATDGIWVLLPKYLLPEM
ncbi:hypothetical protein HZ326_19524 [Fusarium oxysporum f. sp. albedinis]|nr:hypothetical protein HZ326_19524 [Fusarium oxysporum f. sp. albedinis]